MCPNNILSINMSAQYLSLTGVLIHKEVIFALLLLTYPCSFSSVLNKQLLNFKPRHSFFMWDC